MHISRPKLVASIAAVLALVALLATPQLLGSRVSDALDALAGANRFWLAVGALGFLGGVPGHGRRLARRARCGGRPDLPAAGGGAHRRRLHGQLVRPGQARRRRQDRALLEGDRRPRPDLDDRRRLRRARRGAVADARAAARRRLGDRRDADLAGLRHLWRCRPARRGRCVLGTASVAPAHRTRPRRAGRTRALTARDRDGARLDGRHAADAPRRHCRRGRGARAAASAARGARSSSPPSTSPRSFPITPGGIGVGSGAVAVALASRGIGMSQALGVGIAIQALETLVSVTVGSIGGLYLAWPGAAVRRWTFRVATVGRRDRGRRRPRRRRARPLLAGGLAALGVAQERRRLEHLAATARSGGDERAAPAGRAPGADSRRDDRDPHLARRAARRSSRRR